MSARYASNRGLALSHGTELGDGCFFHYAGDRFFMNRWRAARNRDNAGRHTRLPIRVSLRSLPWLSSRHQPTQLSVFYPNTSPHPSPHSYTKCSTVSSSNSPRNAQHSIPIGPRGRASGLLEIAVSAMLRPTDPSIQLATLGAGVLPIQP